MALSRERQKGEAAGPRGKRSMIFAKRCLARRSDAPSGLLWPEELPQLVFLPPFNPPFRSLSLG